MNDYEPTSDSPAGSSSTITVDRERPRRSLFKKKGAWIVAAGMTAAMLGFTGVGAASADTVPPGGAPVAAPAEGGATGIVDSTAAGSFTFTTAEGIVVTVDEDSSTSYKLGPLPAWSGIVQKGESVLVLGLVDTATIDATQVTVQPLGDGGVAAAQAAGVIPFEQGVTSPTQSVGTIPTDYTQGDGTIVTGTVANKATTAAEAVVPGGVVDRVVLLSGGDYEVHNISVNWPHHIFLNSDFQVIGWE
jgi:hypothetical protein